jgi:hypothetical protein
MCGGVIDAFLSFPVDLSMQMLPSPVLQYGASQVSVEKVAYWLTRDGTNVEIPAVDLYVGAAAAKGLSDPSIALLGSIGALPAMSPACTDGADANAGAPSMTPSCDAKLTDAGKSAFAAFAKDYKTPFQISAHIKVVTQAGHPLPTGAIGFAIRPTIVFSVQQ